MPPKIRDLKRKLRAAGFSSRPGKGSHTVWTHPALPSEFSLSGHDGGDAREYQERAVDALISEVEQDKDTSGG